MWFVETSSGAMMPLNPEPDPKGTIGILRDRRTLMGGPVAVVVTDDVMAARCGADRYTSHFSNCPNAGQHRRAGS
jgi:hypothetical protein